MEASDPIKISVKITCKWEPSTYGTISEGPSGLLGRYERRQAAKSLKISRDSVAKMLSYSTPSFAVDQNVGRFHSMFLRFTY